MGNWGDGEIAAIVCPDSDAHYEKEPIHVRTKIADSLRDWFISNILSDRDNLHPLEHRNLIFLNLGKDLG